MPPAPPLSTPTPPKLSPPDIDCSTQAKCKATCGSTYEACGDGDYYCCASGAGCSGHRTCASNPGLKDCACPLLQPTPPPTPPPPDNSGVVGVGIALLLFGMVQAGLCALFFMPVLAKQRPPGEKKLIPRRNNKRTSA